MHAMPTAPHEPSKRKSTPLSTWIAGVVVLLVLAAIAMPDMRDYEMRAKVSEARFAARPVQDAVESFFAKDGKLPPESSNDAPEFGVPLSAANKYMPVTLSGGRVAVTPRGMEKLGAIYLTPSVQGGRISWVCSAPGIQASYLPSDCR